MERTSTGRALVTGGTGFVGSHLVELLLRKGYEVTCLARDPGRLRWLSGLKVRVVTGDCSEPRTLDEAVKNVSVIYHVAGLTKSYRVRDYYTVNQLGTRNLLEACVRQNPRIGKFVLVSSLAAVGPSHEERPVTDRDVPNPITDYGKSKLLAEEEALRFKDHFPVVIMRPSAVYGPRDTDVFELFKWASKGVMLDMLGGNRFLNWCYVEDLAEALLLSGERTVPSGSIYFVAEDRAYSTTEFRQALLKTGGVKAAVVTVPVWMGYAIGAISEALGGLRKKPAIVNRQKVQEAVQRYWTCDMSKARQDLGFIAQVPLEQGLDRTWKWYREQKWIN
jgi:nucleoside-diphosphate-sugar epimerase